MLKVLGYILFINNPLINFFFTHNIFICHKVSNDTGNK